MEDSLLMKDAEHTNIDSAEFSNFKMNNLNTCNTLKRRKPVSVETKPNSITYTGPVQNENMVSRSGRKIKPKKLLYDSEIDNTSICKLPPKNKDKTSRTSANIPVNKTTEFVTFQWDDPQVANDLLNRVKANTELPEDLKKLFQMALENQAV